MAPVLGIIADDYTGATLVAGLLQTRDILSSLVFDPAVLGPGETAPVVIVAARTRTTPVADALAEADRIARALLAAGCTRLAYKACATFDSVAEGNIGPIADHLAALAGRRPVLLSAGFPRLGTTVHQGYLFYRGRLVSESIKRFDPLTPMSDPDLVRFLSLQTPHPVALLPHGVLAAGPAAAEARLTALAEAGAGHVLLDASDDGDVAVSADLAVRTGLPVAASDPLILDLATRLAAGNPQSFKPLALPDGPTAVLAGSTGPVVMAQLAALSARHPVLTLDLLDPRSPEDQVAAALNWTARQGGVFAVSTACDAEGLARSQSALGALGAARRAEALLAAVAAGLRARGVRRFLVAGGETSGAVVAALGIRRARALGEGPLGAGFCVSDDGDDPVLLYLKPGKLGADDILLRAAEGEGPPV